MNPLSQPAKFGAVSPGVFANVVAGINTGLAVYQTAHQGGAGGGGSGQTPRTLTGSGLIDQIAAQYHSMQAAGAPSDQLLAFLQAALQLLSDPAQVWDNSAYHDQAIAVVNNEIRRLQSGGAPSGNLTNVAVANGGATAMSAAGASPQLITGVPNSYLLVGGAIAIVGGYMLLKKN